MGIATVLPDTAWPGSRIMVDTHSDGAFALIALRVAMVLSAVVALLLPPRWCCAIPGLQAECCEACRKQADSAHPCCHCGDSSQKKTPPRGPCKCVCHTQAVHVVKGPDHPDQNSPLASVSAPQLDAPRAASAHFCEAAQPADTPQDLQATLCRWLC